jgi:hypothetical protein
MVGIIELWLPILLSAVAVFIASSIIHMLLPWHKGEYRQMPDEDKVMEALRQFSITPGDYLLPCPKNPNDIKSAEYIEKRKKGPVMVATVGPNGDTGMGLQLFLWFVYSLVIGIFAAYVAGRALTADALPLQVFRFVGVSAFLAYSGSLWQMTIWYRRSWIITLKSSIDGLIYACVTAGIFVWLWP